MSTQSSRKSQTNVTTTQAPQSTTVHLKPRPKKKAVKWNESVVDNEDMGKRSSKICCQYEPPRNWSDSSSSDSDSSSEGEGHECSHSHGGHDHSHSHHHKKRSKPVQHPFDDQPFTGDYAPKAPES